MKKSFYIFILVLFYTGYVSAQNISALQMQLKYIKQDTSGVRLLNNLSTAFYKNNQNDSCKKYAAMALHLTDKLLNTGAAKRNAAYTMQCKMLKAQAIQNIGSSLHYEDLSKGIDTLRAALKLWKETGDKKGMASAFLRLGELYSSQSDYVNALKYFDTSLSLYKQSNDTGNTGYIYYQIALNERYMGNYGDALESNINALTIGRAIKDTSLITLSLLANGFVYMYVKNFTEALKNQQAALSIFLTNHDSVGIATVYNDMGVTNMRAGNLDTALNDHSTALIIRKQVNDYIGVGNSCGYISQILQQQGKYEQALANNIEALKYAKLSGNVNYILDAYNDAGSIYLKMHDDENALKNYNIVLQVTRKINDRKRQAEALKNISEIFLSQGKPNEAITWLQKAASITEADDFRNLRIIYKDLSAAYVKTGDYKNAYESSIKFKQFNDSVVSNEKAEKLASLTNQLAFENKQALQKASQDKQLAVQQSEIELQKLVRNVSIAGLLFVIILAIIFFIRLREKRKLNSALEQTLTNLKSTQSLLVQAEKMASLGELTAGIAHEIRNPLNFINNFSEVNTDLINELKVERLKEERNEKLEDEILNDLSQNLEKISHHSKRAEAIVKGMLQHSRKNTGQKEVTDINALADEYLRLSYHGLRAKDKSFNADFKTDFDESIGKINIVPQDIGRVLLNLFNNAFYAVNEKLTAHRSPLTDNYKPLVSIQTKKINGKIEIKVTDNGNGIPQNIIDKIFQPFFTTKPTGQGTGLGLSLSYDIITKEHNGKIKVESKEGEGSEFVIQLPVV